MSSLSKKEGAKLYPLL